MCMSYKHHHLVHHIMDPVITGCFKRQPIDESRYTYLNILIILYDEIWTKIS